MRARRQTSCGFFSKANLELVRGSVNERFVLATMSTPGQWAGGLRAWGDASSSAGYRATGIAGHGRPHVHRAIRRSRSPRR